MSEADTKFLFDLGVWLIVRLMRLGTLKDWLIFVF